jgi:hypothetical protein
VSASFANSSITQNNTVIGGESVILTDMPDIQEVYNAYVASGFEIEFISESENSAEYIIKSADIPDFEAHMAAVIDISGNQLLKITEGDKYDEVQFCTDGKILLNNSPVVITIEYEDFNDNTAQYNSIQSVNDAATITPRGGHRIYYQSDAPYGTNSQYTSLSSTVSKTLTLDQAISSVATATLVAIVIAAFGFGGLSAGLISVVIAGLITWFNANNTTAKAFSAIEKSYTHNTNGFNVTSSMSTYKKVVSYYAYTNYTGYLDTNTFWQVFAY